jgi:AcrR family transcriptional regulator
MSGSESNDTSKRDAILRAAWKLIRHYGYTKTTIQDIAREAGIGKGTVYLSFRSKSEIMLGLVDRTSERITRDLTDISRGSAPPEHRLRECLAHRVMTIYDLVHRYPHGEEVISSMKPEIVRRIDATVKKQGAVLGRIIREGVEDGSFDVTDPEETGLVLAGLYEHFTPPYYRFRSRKSLEQFVGSVTDLLLEGMRSGKHPDDRGLVGASAPGDEPARVARESGEHR